MAKAQVIDALIQALGKEKVVTDPEDLICYSFDATADMPSKLPDVVVVPASTNEVVQIINIAREYKVPVYPRGSGTNLSGGTIPIQGGIVVSMQGMNKILEIDADNLVAVVQPGVVIQDLNNAVAPFGLIYPPDPGTVATATMGGSVSECSGGLRGLKYGVTKHYVMGLEVVLADGSVARFGGKTVKNVTAYDMVKLFTGAEGTLGIITEITVKLIPAPEARKSMLAIFNNLADAGNTVTEIVRSKVIPATMEIMDKVTIQTVENFAKVGLPTNAEALLLIEVDGIPEVVEREAAIVVKVVEKNKGKIQVAKDDKERDGLWAARRAALPALAQVKPTTVLEDATVPRSKITEMLVALQDIAKKYNLQIGTFGHAGDGNLHPTILTDARDTEEMERVHQAVDEIFKTALSLGGTISGEHGIGMAKAKYLPLEFGDSGMEAMRKVKQALDPDNLLNPGKMLN
ncbi:D-lactate dehydrogenase (cytochrome) [Desulfotomaculum nigrificans CO-1-SRB]|uniref:D-lactate dehydrogenase (Cytochrome) n=1 Tax=Desulfotomaculum nigrificans (strain DSM 14880 / VKM B-2319 / CO-1-SRB) TaxID=868595 RepID=F6B9G7_DESCC|nr:FAD-linked oxidase C-terminal domain-containing protein [Desulfotomaculum nigrificans]AEF93743.1 D-lactate dehydrogenase (cytochrome) [Desulfotomaculum nigrificans CO-1-SRB]